MQAMLISPRSFLVYLSLVDPALLKKLLAAPTPRVPAIEWLPTEWATASKHTLYPRSPLFKTAPTSGFEIYFAIGSQH